jgi:hypothetical protein
MPGYWTIDLNLSATESSGVCATIEYTSPDCGGTLEQCERKGDEIHTVEKYTHSKECAPPGKVILRCADGVMHYTWIGWERVDSKLSRPAGYVSPPTITPPSSSTAPLPSSSTDDPPKKKKKRKKRPEVDDRDDEQSQSCMPRCSVGVNAPGSGMAGMLMMLLIVLRRRTEPT